MENYVIYEGKMNRLVRILFLTLIVASHISYASDREITKQVMQVIAEEISKFDPNI